MLYANYNTTHTFNRSAAKSQKPSETKAKKNNNKPKTKSQESSETKAKSQKPNGHANWFQTAANSTQIRDFGSKMLQIQARSQKPKEPEAKNQKPKARNQKPKNKCPSIVIMKTCAKHTKRLILQRKLMWVLPFNISDATSCLDGCFDIFVVCR